MSLHLSVSSQPRSRNRHSLTSRPVSPEEQLDIMRIQEKKMRAMEGEPNEKDLEASIKEFSNDALS